jgi:hypothetical protein
MEFQTKKNVHDSLRNTSKQQHENGASRFHIKGLFTVVDARLHIMPEFANCIRTAPLAVAHLLHIF